jgi:hypothetical protein
MKYSKTILATACLFATTFSHAMHYQPPLKIDNAYVSTKGSVITGNYQGTLTEPAISITTSSPVIIENANLTGPGDLIFASNANLIVRNTVGVSTNPNVIGQHKGMFLDATNIINLRVENCNITGSSFAVYIGNYAGNHTSAQTIKILNNTIYNIDGRNSDGNGGYVAAGGPVNAYDIQMIFANNVPGIEIAWNEIVNDYVNSSGLSSLQLFDTGGVATSHLLIHDNFIRGNSNSLITITTLGNDSAMTTSAFVDIYNNQIISSSNYGVALTGGHDIAVYNNRVISSGYTPQGIFIANQNATGLLNTNSNNLPPTVFFNNHIHDNLVGYIAGTGRSDWSLSGQNDAVENNIAWLPQDNTHPTLTDEDHEYQTWKTKVGRNNIRLGAN